MFGKNRLSPIKIKELPGKEIGVSDWLEITQQRINNFAESTEDRQWIHVDPERASKSPLGGTVAHGFLLLSLIPAFLAKAPLFQMKFKMAVNYGLNRVRFISPVRPGMKVRNRAVLKAIEKRGFRRLMMTIDNTIDIEGEKRPALVAELLVLILL
jgi:acyl dehydratase